MFDLRNYIKEGFLKAIGKMADFQIILNSAGYHEKGVLTEDDLAEIKSAIDKQYEVTEELATEVEENPEEITETIVENTNDETIENTEV